MMLMLVRVSCIFFFMPFAKKVICLKNRFVQFTYLLWCLPNLIQICDKFFLPRELSC